MLNKPPMVPTYKTPEDIIGRNNMDIFNDHYRIATSSVNGGEFPNSRLDKEIGKAVRPEIAEAYERLRESGFVPLGYKSDGNILWGVVTKSDSLCLFEKGLAELRGMSLEQLKSHIGKSDYKKYAEKMMGELL